MKRFLIVLLLGLTFTSFGQKRFKKLSEYESWLMHYYANPEPARLFDAFDYGVRNKKIAKDGNGMMVIGFFSSCLREDTVAQKSFYQKIADTKDENLIYDFGLTLWQAHTDFSIKLLNKFLKQSNTKKYSSDFNKLKREKFINIWNDPITHPDQLDMLWTDFFATGNEKSVRKIISKLADLNSGSPFDQATASSAQWSLTSNSIQHQRVLEICTLERESASGAIRQALEKIIEVANNAKKK